MTHDIPEEESEYKSKTQIKREMEALQALGELLLDVPPGVYKKMPIPEELDDALQTIKKIKSHSARRRQLQYIGKVMRQIDAAPIQAAVDEWRNGHKKLAREFHKLEQLRDDLLDNKNGVLQTVINDHPECDIQHLRQLIRMAQQERKQEKPPKNYRKLFQLLKSLYQPEADNDTQDET